ncbi:uncharacterized protein [Antennarius striatus]
MCVKYTLLLVLILISLSHVKGHYHWSGYRFCGHMSKFCPPVCGANGVSYDNVCELWKDASSGDGILHRMKLSINIQLHLNFLHNFLLTPTCRTSRLLLNTMCVKYTLLLVLILISLSHVKGRYHWCRFGFRVHISRLCKPVCGTNGVSYDNFSELWKDSRSSKKEIKILKYGKC